MRGKSSSALARVVVLLALVLGATLLQAADGASEPMPTAFTEFCATATHVVHHLPPDLPGIPVDPTTVLEASLVLFALVLVAFVAVKRHEHLTSRTTRGPTTRQAHVQVPQLAQLCVLRT